MDPLALRVANLLVGNEPTEAGLELTLLGPSLRFTSDALIAICGGDLLPRVGESSVPAWRPIWIPSGSELHFGAAVAGCRAYLAVAGGLEIPLVLGSRGTYFRAGFGGLDGRPLRAGDYLATRPASPLVVQRGLTLARQAAKRSIAATTWWAKPSAAVVPDTPTIRVSPGRQFHDFSDDERQTFLSSEFSVTPDSDRMGYRLQGPAVRTKPARELISEAVTVGTVQVPPNGQPVILMADSPVTGGYPKIAQVASVDLTILAQLRPGSKLRFELIPTVEAWNLYRQREAELIKLNCAIAMRWDLA
jgi:antagonist of KipI